LSLASRRIGKWSMKQWANEYGRFDDWARLGLLIGATGYLEVFTRRIIDTAIQSCPALLIGCHRDVDGVHLLKKKLSYSYAKEAEACTKGTWPQRIAQYEKIFESLPPFISSKVSELERTPNT
jgi:hypothetical protein